MSPLLALIASAARDGGQPMPPQALTPDMQNTPAFNQMVADYNVQNPVAPQQAASVPQAPGPQLAPEPPQVTAPTASPGPSQPVPASQAPARHHGGLLGALKSVFMPQADSLWAGALRDGIWNAHQSQDAYKQNQALAATKGEQAQVELDASRQKALKGDLITTPTGSIIRIGPGGIEKLYEPPQKDDAKSSLIERWHQARDAGDHSLMNVLERAIGGYQYTPEVIAAQGEARTNTGVAIQRAKPKPVGRAGAVAKPPAGFIINP